MQTDSYNPYQVAQSQFDKVAGILELDDGVKELLRQPMREYHFTIPV
ncbi:MAG: glutamate dehydrogenase, partial [Lentisphaerae bacterium]|nr:glutamate dehydrogenase [Lentisphaerota bacterium]